MTSVAPDLLDIRDGTTLLVDGAAGGVGSIVVQLAVARGARVIGTARPDSHQFLRELGVEPVDYGRGLPVRIRALTAAPVDRALDVAGAGSLSEHGHKSGGHWTVTVRNLRIATSLANADDPRAVTVNGTLACTEYPGAGGV